jgi:hypothetical protein
MMQNGYKHRIPEAIRDKDAPKETLSDASQWLLIILLYSGIMTILFIVLFPPPGLVTWLSQLPGGLVYFALFGSLILMIIVLILFKEEEDEEQDEEPDNNI